MNPNVKKLAIFLIVLFAAMGAVYALFTWPDWRRGAVYRAETNLPRPDQQKKEVEEERQEAKIFYPTPDGKYLYAENRLLKKVKEPEAMVRVLVEELLKGPGDGGYTTIPRDIKLMNSYLDGKGSVYLDFSAELKQKHISGTWAEALTVYSIVNTMTANIDNAERVLILIDGSVAKTLGGHLALDQPFSPLAEIIKEN